ncbi:MAG: hypothetical protein WC529_01360 [Candidatus Margulisiibacteriota bacterium]
MAPEIRCNLTLALLVCLAAAALAASKADIKKFPPVAGEIYGQAASGVRSISVNGKPVTFDASQNFKANVRMKAGEKYLVLRINYEGLRIIKKYLILRKSAIKKFKVFVPKEKLEKELKAIKLSPEEKLRQKREKLLAQKKKAEAARLFAQERKLQAENNWLKRVASPKFYQNEFKLKPGSTPEGLALAIALDNPQLKLQPAGTALEQLNTILKVPDFYDLIKRSGKKPKLTPQLKRLIAETAAFRGKPFAKLSAYQQKKVMLLNRLLIETLYAAAPARQVWETAAGQKAGPAGPKTVEYLYVWEFGDGKLLLVKEYKGQYSAEINIPVSKQWLDLKGLSEKELRELIEQPVSQPKKKWNIIKPWGSKQ